MLMNICKIFEWPTYSIRDDKGHIVGNNLAKALKHIEQGDKKNQNETRT